MHKKSGDSQEPKCVTAELIKSDFSLISQKFQQPSSLAGEQTIIFVMLSGKPGAGLSGGQLMMMIITDYPGMETSDTAFPHLHCSPAHNQVHISATRRDVAQYGFYVESTQTKLSHFRFANISISIYISYDCNC